jgi:glycosyltransferase involved in cell wall biosynthesis
MISAEYPPLPGGVGDYTRRLAQKLVQRGKHVAVFTIDDLRFTIYDIQDVERNHVPKIVDPTSNWGWRSWRGIQRAIEQTQPDIVHIQYQTGAYAMRPAINFLPWRLRRAARRPAVVVTAHDLLPPYLFPKAGRLRQWVTRRLLADADAVVLTNEEDYAQVREWGMGDEGWGRLAGSHPPSPIPHSPTIIPIGSNIVVAPGDGYDRAAWRARLQIEADQTLLANFGLISHTKGLDTLIDALARMPARYRLLIIGGVAPAPEDRAYASAIRQQIGRLGLEQRVTLTGHCDEADVSAHLLAADIAALPFADGASFRRGSLLAALAHGLPVVTTLPTKDQGPKTKEGNRMLARSLAPSSSVIGPLVDGANALLVPPGDAPALAGAIERLVADPQLRERLAAGGQALAAQFSWDSIAAQHEQLYARLIDR